jgi:predicted nucleic acid-binding protein
MPFVLDASVALSWHMVDEDSDYSTAVLEYLSFDPATVPALWLTEVANGLLVAQRRGRLTPEEVDEAVRLTLEAPVRVQEPVSESLLRTTIETARRFNLTAYDAAYLNLASSLRLPLATLDEDLIEAAPRAGVELLRP